MYVWASLQDIGLPVSLITRVLISSETASIRTRVPLGTFNITCQSNRVAP